MNLSQATDLKDIVRATEISLKFSIVFVCISIVVELTSALVILCGAKCFKKRKFVILSFFMGIIFALLL